MVHISRTQLELKAEPAHIEFDIVRPLVMETQDVEERGFGTGHYRFSTFCLAAFLIIFLVFITIRSIDDFRSCFIEYQITKNTALSIHEVLLEIRPDLKPHLNKLGLYLGRHGYHLLKEITVSDVLDMNDDFGKVEHKPIQVTPSTSVKFYYCYFMFRI